MPSPTILLAMKSLAETTAADHGRQFIETLCKDKRLTPERLGHAEEYDHDFGGIDDFVLNWWTRRASITLPGGQSFDYYRGPSWKRKSPLAGHGFIKHGGEDVRGRPIPSYFWFESRWARDVGFQQLFERWVSLAPPEVAMLHLFSGVEQSSPQGSLAHDFEIGAFGGPMRPGLPNIGWAMAYGTSYAHEVDVGRIRRAGFSVDERGDYVTVRVTENLSDVVDDFSRFSRRRAELKALFRRDLFWIRDEPSVT